ncbi:uncharacterized protein LOC135371249 [Ornithodoros turicata]|uniref:uncharacterized protein LOC135371249 n=1 Tax=Ornithodoros turicata TaxID=34597 RepID=UPI0031398CC7
MTRRVLMTRLDKRLEDMKEHLVQTFDAVECVAVTADCWTSFHRTLLGVMALWLEPDSLERRSAALALRRLTGRVTYDKLADALSEVFQEYKIRGKVTKVITDNGPNFIKAFRLYGGEAEVTDFAGEEPVEVGRLMDDAEDAGIRLPPHHRCAAHTLNLVATHDASRAENDAEFANASKSAIKKCTALWNRQGQSTAAADIIKRHCGIYLVRPVATRWNSLYDSLECILRLKGQGVDLNTLLCTLGLPLFQCPQDVTFIEEYCPVMKPVARALDLLQGEKTMYMGYMLPTITVLRRMLEYQAMKGLRYCGPLAAALLDGLHKRFEHHMHDDTLLVSSVVTPRFKLAWITEEERRKITIELVKARMDSQPLCHQPNKRSSAHNDYATAEDFFAFGNATSHSNPDDEELSRFLLLPEDFKLASLKANFPNVHRIFIRTNTASSASVERLFSVCADTLTKKRTKITDGNFERQLLLRVNRNV